jgi:predicted RNase H-like nuclease (RuvC/YqgF family)
MKAKIAVATLSGKAYYLLVNELKARGLDFLSLIPNDNIPLEIEVVITTAKERHLVKHPKILVYETEQKPSEVIEEAIRELRGKKTHETITVGVDPGKTFGMAVISDGNVLETTTCSSKEDTVNMVVNVLSKLQAAAHIVKVGNGAPGVANELLSALDEALPGSVTIEVVSEAGTSRFIGESLHKRGLRDALSAVKIAERRGQPYQRKIGGKQQE